MHDIKYIRENPENFDVAMKARGLEPQAQNILKLDVELREQQTHLQQLLTQRNEVAKEIGSLKKQGLDATAPIEKSNAIKTQIPEVEQRVDELQQSVNKFLYELPNIPNEQVPIGADESFNKEIKHEGVQPELSFTPKTHEVIAEDLQMLNLEQARAISGARFNILQGGLALLERALANFMLDINTSEYGYTEVSPPILVRDEAMFGAGQLPKFAEDSFLTTNGYRLIPTAEVSLVNMVAGKITPELELPLRLTAHTPCFRSEAGSAGKDMKGIFRQHQFYKVELVSITNKHDSIEEHERMLSNAEEILKRLGLHYRVMLLSSGDMGFHATKTYDLEVWLPGQKQYREISSVSNCEDFQGRRMNARYKDFNSNKNYFVHTLNGSALAIGRTIIAILENYQNADGSVEIPKVLHKYMNGITKLELKNGST